MVFYHIYNVFGKDQNQKSDDKEPIQIKKKISTNQHDVKENKPTPTNDQK